MIVKDPKQFRALFVLKGLATQKQIAEALDVSQNTVTRWFQGEPMLLKQARQIAKFLDQPLEDLFEEKREERVLA